MKRYYVYLAIASVFFAIVWGVGVVPAVYVLRKTKNLPEQNDPKNKRDLRGARLFARGGLIINLLVLVLVCWSLISTYILH